MVAAYYKYKKESLNLKFNSAKDTLKLMQGAIDEYNISKSVYIKRAGFYGFFDEKLTAFLVAIIKIRNRYTHDYYKRERVEEDIINYAMLKMNLLEIFLKISEEKVRLDAKNF